MLYGDRTLGAWRLYPYAYDRLSHVNQQSVATPEGFVCGDSQRQREPSPHNSLLLFKRSGRELVLLDKITAQDGLVPTGIAWRGVEQIATNFDRIEPRSLPVSSETRIAGNRARSDYFARTQGDQIDSGISARPQIRFA